MINQLGLFLRQQRPVGVAMLKVSDLTPYEKGVVARWLLGELIERGNVWKEDPRAFDISICVPRWQIKLLAQFCKKSEDVKVASDTAQQPHIDCREILIEAARPHQ